jgi:hypothetical protein
MFSQNVSVKKNINLVYQKHNNFGDLTFFPTFPLCNFNIFLFIDR